MNINPRIVAGATAGILALSAAVASKWEGLRLGVYADPVGILTACRGHTGKDVVMGKVYTMEECEAFFDQDLKDAYTAVKQCTRVAINDNEASAYTSFSYNVGASAFCGSTLVKKLNAGDHTGACGELMKWVYANGKFFKGLAARRAEEKQLCLKPFFGNVTSGISNGY